MAIYQEKFYSSYQLTDGATGFHVSLPLTVQDAALTQSQNSPADSYIVQFTLSATRSGSTSSRMFVAEYLGGVLYDYDTYRPVLTRGTAINTSYAPTVNLVLRAAGEVAIIIVPPAGSGNSTLYVVRGKVTLSRVG